MENNLRKPLAKSKKLLYNNTMNNLKHTSFLAQQEYRTISSPNCADMPWLVDRGFV